MHIRAMFDQLIEGAVQIVAAFIIVLLQRWMLELSSYKQDIAWLKRQRMYGLFMSARWYRGMEAYHQWNAYRIWNSL